MIDDVLAELEGRFDLTAWQDSPWLAGELVLDIDGDGNGRVGPFAPHYGLGVHDGTLDDALTGWPWRAADWHRRKAARTVRLEIIRDTRPGEPIIETLPDEPISFDPAHRQHTWRSVLRRQVDVTNDLAERAAVAEHDPLSLLGG